MLERQVSAVVGGELVNDVVVTVAGLAVEMAFRPELAVQGGSTHGGGSHAEQSATPPVHKPQRVTVNPPSTSGAQRITKGNPK